MLELATMEYPYSECRSIPAIFRKVSQVSREAVAAAALQAACASGPGEQAVGAAAALQAACFRALESGRSAPRGCSLVVVQQTGSRHPVLILGLVPQS